jgi:hypothetical protein
VDTDADSSAFRLDADDIERIARRVVELLHEDGAARASRLVDAATVARELGVARDWVYLHARVLGGVRLGGPRGRLRFDLPDRARTVRRRTPRRHHQPRQASSPTAPARSTCTSPPQASVTGSCCTSCPAARAAAAVDGTSAVHAPSWATRSPAFASASGHRRRQPHAAEQSARVPTFHEYATYWLAAKIDGVIGDTGGISQNTIHDYRTRLTVHLLPSRVY